MRRKQTFKHREKKEGKSGKIKEGSQIKDVAVFASLALTLNRVWETDDHRISLFNGTFPLMS